MRENEENYDKLDRKQISSNKYIQKSIKKTQIKKKKVATNTKENITNVNTNKEI